MRKPPRRWASTVLTAALIWAIEMVAPASGAGSAVCPSPPSTLADLISTDAVEAGTLTQQFRPVYGAYAEVAAACWGDAEIEVAGFVAGPEGLGGVSSFTIEPLWMISREHSLSTTDAVDPDAGPVGPFFAVAVRPLLEDGVTALMGRWVRVSGHFHDPAAETCVVASTTPDLGAVPTVEQAIAICRTSFVLTAVEPLAAPPTDTASLERSSDAIPGGVGFIVVLAGVISFALVLRRRAGDSRSAFPPA